MWRAKTGGIKRLFSLRNAYLFCAGYFAMLISFQVLWLPISLGFMLMGLFWLLSGAFREKVQVLRSNTYAGLLFAYFFVVLISSFYSPDAQQAEAKLVLRIPMLVWPLMLGSIAILGHRAQRMLLRIFVIGTALSLVVCLVLALFKYMAYPHLEVFFFEELVPYYMIPPHYMGMYVNFAYGLLLYSIIRGRSYIGPRWLSFATLGLLVVALILLSARMQYLVFFAIHLYLFYHFYRGRLSTGGLWLRGSAIFLIFMGLALALPESRARLYDTYNELRSWDQMVDNKQTNARKYLWQASLKVIGEQPWLGSGNGGENQRLHEELAREPVYFWNGVEREALHERGLNYHNSYLQHFAAGGLPGLLSFLALFLVPLWKGVSPPHRREAGLFLLICGFSFATESMLQRQAGVMFFSFFYALLFALPISRKGEETTEKGKKYVE